MNFLKRSTTAQVEDASALQLALLEEAERNIYGDTALWTQSNTQTDGTKRLYENIFDHSESDTDYHDVNHYGTGKSLFPLFDCVLYLFPMWITKNRRFAIFNIIGIFVTFIFATFYRFDTNYILYGFISSLHNLTNIYYISLDALTGGKYTGLDADNLQQGIGSA